MSQAKAPEGQGQEGAGPYEGSGKAREACEGRGGRGGKWREGCT